MGGVASASGDGVVDRKNLILLANHPASPKPSAPLLARRELYEKNLILAELPPRPPEAAATPPK
jgi:hypothetical protein